MKRLLAILMLAASPVLANYWVVTNDVNGLAGSSMTLTGVVGDIRLKAFALDGSGPKDISGLTIRLDVTAHIDGNTVSTTGVTESATGGEARGFGSVESGTNTVKLMAVPANAAYAFPLAWITVVVTNASSAGASVTVNDPTAYGYTGNTNEPNFVRMWINGQQATGTVNGANLELYWEVTSTPFDLTPYMSNGGFVINGQLATNGAVITVASGESGITNTLGVFPGILPTFPGISTAGWERVVLVASNPAATSSPFIDEYVDDKRVSFQFGYTFTNVNAVYYKRGYSEPATLTVYRVASSIPVGNSVPIYLNHSGNIGFLNTNGTFISAYHMQGYLCVSRFNATGLFNSDLLISGSVGPILNPSTHNWWRLIAANSRRTFQVSVNGVDWLTLYSGTSTDFAASTNFFFGAQFTQTSTATTYTQRLSSVDYYYMEVE